MTFKYCNFIFAYCYSSIICEERKHSMLEISFTLLMNTELRKAVVRECCVRNTTTYFSEVLFVYGFSFKKIKLQLSV